MAYFTDAEFKAYRDAHPDAGVWETIAALLEAPSDNKQYARKDGAWVLAADETELAHRNTTGPNAGKLNVAEVIPILPVGIEAASVPAFEVDGSGNAVWVAHQALSSFLRSYAVGPYTETVVAIGTVGASHTISLAVGTFQTATLTASTATTFTMPTATAGKSFIMHLKQAATTGNGTATFTGVKWDSGGTPVITATAGKMDILTFSSDGTNWYGAIAQGYTP